MDPLHRQISTETGRRPIFFGLLYARVSPRLLKATLQLFLRVWRESRQRFGSDNVAIDCAVFAFDSTGAVAVVTRFSRSPELVSA